MSEPIDLLIVGAGPAGLAAAIEARALGASVTLLDENPAAGGQVWRGIEANGARGKKLDADYAAGAELAAAFRQSGAEARFGATVWSLEPEADEAPASVFFSQNGHAARLRARRVLLATGATERPVPIPGWTLPGVMTVGAAQILLKTAGLAPQGRVWLAGQGPLLRLYAVQALAAGAQLAGILDLSPPIPLGLVTQVPAMLGALDYMVKGFSWGRKINAAGVPWVRAGDIAAEAGSDGKLARVSFTTGGQHRTEDADLLLLHDGVVPNTQISRALGLAHEWDGTQMCWRPKLDAFGRSAIDSVFIAGDGGGILGAQGALLTGRIAALAALADMARITHQEAQRRIGPLRQRLAKHEAIRGVLDTLYPPVFPLLDDATIVCRCEEVSAGALREAVKLGCLGLNQMKAFTRCGMGPCQGRMCAPTAAAVMAEARGVPVAAIEPYRGRFPTKPLTLGELAALDG
jgi:NADPH-dependent 2,4-dienoyl-CoA reductase/sulfur reductase-like enzyme